MVTENIESFSSDSGLADRELACLNSATGMIPAMIPDRFPKQTHAGHEKRTVRGKSIFADDKGVSSELEMPQDVANDGPVGDGSDKAQGTLVTLGASGHVEGKHTPRNLAQSQPDETGLAYASMPCWRGNGVMAPRSLLGAAK
jgi:hypothetical protein